MFRYDTFPTRIASGLICLISLYLFPTRALGIVLNEVMYNPEGDENENEYIELYNNDITPINLSEWRVTDGGDTDRIAAFEQGLQVYPGQYILILDPDYFENGSTQYDGRIPEGALVVTIDNGAFGERGLSNSNAETVSILNDAGLCVAAYTYSLGNQSGYSDEKIIPSAGDSSSNWSDSRTYGGTPGGRNSVTPLDHDLAITYMSYAPLGAEPEDQITIQIIVKNVGLFVMQDSLLLYKQNLMVSNPDSLQEIRRWFTGALQPGDTNSFVHEWTIPDDSLHVFVSRLLSTDDNHTNNEWVMMVNPGGTAGWIVINEIMYQPEPLRAEWVEIYNSGVSTWSGVGWSFGDGTGIEDTTRRCNFADVVLAPSRYLVIASDSSIYFENVPVESPIVVWNDSPISLNNSGDSLFLYDNYGQITDRVDYRPSWGNGQAGVSIERISAASSSNDPTNWAASLDSTGATPGRINSRVLPEFQSVTDLLVLEPNPFSPDGDGHDDILAVRFALDHADSRLDLKIYDVRGREVRRLANNEAAGYMGERLWDGKDNNGRELPTGIYIVYLEALGKGGTRIQSTKRVVALARRS